jgi:hypothetical protein
MKTGRILKPIFFKKFKGLVKAFQSSVRIKTNDSHQKCEKNSPTLV